MTPVVAWGPGAQLRQAPVLHLVLRRAGIDQCRSRFVRAHSVRAR